MNEITIQGRKHNESVKTFAGRLGVLRNTLHKRANKTYRDRCIKRFLIRGPTSLIN